MDAETLDHLLSREALKKGWAENKCLYAARILQHVLKDVEDKAMRQKMREVAKFLNEYKLCDAE